MIYYKVGNLLHCTESVLVHGCNAQGVMGSGVAAAIRAEMPRAYEVYRHAYETRGLKLGEIVPALVHRVDAALDMIVVNGITQDMYGRNGKQYVDYDAVREVFNSTVDMCWQLYQDYENGETMDIAIPKIGAGLGGGDWKVIEEIIDEETGADLDVVVYVLNESEIPPNRVRV